MFPKMEKDPRSFASLRYAKLSAGATQGFAKLSEKDQKMPEKD
jgi:hypothetical protein